MLLELCDFSFKNKNKQNYAIVLAPTSEITASLSSSGSHTVTIPSLSITVSPATVRLILNVVKSLQQDKVIILLYVATLCSY